MGKPVVMGRKTCLSIGKPLAGRTNIVVSRDPDFAAAGVLVAPTLTAALAAARGDALRRGADEIVVIGGTDIYAQTIADADRLEITHVHLQPEGDTRFPPSIPMLWREVARSEHPAGPDDAARFQHRDLCASRPNPAAMTEIMMDVEMLGVRGRRRSGAL